MKRSVWAVAVVLLALGSSSVWAQPAATNWTGFYVGLNLGYGWADSSTVGLTPGNIGSNTLSCAGNLGSTCPQSASFSMEGVTGGVQFGYNWQLGNRWLVGLQADYDLTAIKGDGLSNSWNLASGTPFVVNTYGSSHLLDLGTLRGRLGYLFNDYLLVFGSGGWAFGRVRNEAQIINNSAVPTGAGTAGAQAVCTVVGTCVLAENTRWTSGWTAGGGFEYMLPSNPKVSVSFEYLFAHLSTADNFALTFNQSAFFPTTPGAVLNANFSGFDVQTVRVGLNVHF